MDELAIVILAAGQGTRMRSKLPKVLHAIAGRPMIQHVLDVVGKLHARRTVLVVGHGADMVRDLLGDAVDYVAQKQQLGTGDAVLQARGVLDGCSDAVLVLYGDMPLLASETLRSLVLAHQTHEATITMLTCIREDAMGFGRILRDKAGRVLAIVEESEATPEELAISELNPGVYCFDATWLWEHLALLPLSPKGEYYLTDLISMATEEGHPVGAVVSGDALETLGINNRVHLAKAEDVMRRRVRERLMLAGVTMLDPGSTYVDATVSVGLDTIIYPNSYLQGSTSIGSRCRIGPNTIVRDTCIGDGCRVEASVVEGAVIGDDVSVGPFSHLRKGAHLADGVHVGNFGEIKNSSLGEGVRMGHFSYVGDATVGADVNIGAGTVTCNYDGAKKHRTVIEEGVFVGSGTMLVAPVRIGARAHIGAGAVVTHDIPPDSMAYGVPARVRGEAAAREHAQKSGGGPRVNGTRADADVGRGE